MHLLEQDVPSKRELLAGVGCILALCTHRPLLLQIESFSEFFRVALTTVSTLCWWTGKVTEIDKLDDVNVVTMLL